MRPEEDILFPSMVNLANVRVTICHSIGLRTRAMALLVGFRGGSARGALGEAGVDRMTSDVEPVQTLRNLAGGQVPDPVRRGGGVDHRVGAGGPVAPDGAAHPAARRAGG